MVLDGLATKAHFRWVSIEPRLYSLKDGFMLPASDPVKLGLAKSLAHPGGNATA
jgi:hypothetical protein